MKVVPIKPGAVSPSDVEARRAKWREQYRRKCADASFREMRNATVRRWQENNKDKAREAAVATKRKRNGFTREIFAKRVASQSGRCPICDCVLGAGLAANSACADHCHERKIPRGVLCKRCNLLLGHAQDDIARLEKAILYLNFWNEQS